MKIITKICTALLLVIGFNTFGQTSHTFPDDIVRKKIDSIIHKPPLGSVNDLEMLFTNDQKRKLDSLLKVIRENKKTEIVILTLDTVPVPEISFDSTVLLLSNAWRIGSKYSGRGILIGFSKHLRKIRIENSKEIEKVITNDETKEIIDNVIIPQFKKGDCYEGTYEGIIALSKKIK